jgi:hypothetical protein
MTVSQQSDQNAGSGAEQSNEEEASCDTSGLCTVKQMASNDKQRGTNQCGPAMTCDIGLNVQAGFGEGDGVDTCTGDPEEESSCTFPPYSPPEDPLDPGNEAGICDVLPYAPPCYYLG